MHATEHIKHARNQKKQQQQKHNERSTLLHCGFFSRVSAVCLVFNRNLHNTKIVEVKRRELVKKKRRPRSLLNPIARHWRNIENRRIV